MLELKDVSLTAGDNPLFDNLSFIVNPGQILCVSGPNGSGKSHLLHAIMGLVAVDKGYISIDGDILAHSHARVLRQHTAYLPQDIDKYYTSVKDLLYMPFELQCNRANRPTAENIVAQWAQLDLDESLLQRSLAEITPGQQRRMLLSVIPFLKKKVVLLDEPGIGSGLEEIKKMATYIRTMADNGSVVVIASSHDTFIQYSNLRLILGTQS